MRHALAALLLLATPAAAQQPLPSGVTPLELQMPMDCTLGQDCFIQNYVDAEPGPGAKDFTCGPLAYDNHQGTDFRTKNRASLARPYHALAAAPGRIVQAIDGQPENGFDHVANPLSCGNAIMIDHGGGWTTQYCHLANGTVAVREGQAVATGDRLAQVGSSGGTDYPHLHFAVRVQGAVIDPFTGVSPTGCTQPAATPLWSASAGVFHAESAVLGFGVSALEPTDYAIRNGRLAGAQPSGGAAPFYLWTRILGARQGDSVRLIATGPGGPIASEVFAVNEDRTIFIAAIGLSPSDVGAAAWPSGAYEGRLALYRNGQEIGTRQAGFSLP